MYLPKSFLLRIFTFFLQFSEILNWENQISFLLFFVEEKYLLKSSDNATRQKIETFSYSCKSTYPKFSYCNYGIKWLYRESLVLSNRWQFVLEQKKLVINHHLPRSSIWKVWFGVMLCSPIGIPVLTAWNGFRTDSNGCKHSTMIKYRHRPTRESISKHVKPKISTLTIYVLDRSNEKTRRKISNL